ncbi:TPA: hypothetical protein ACSVZR_003492 [Bacillus cereus]
MKTTFTATFEFDPLKDESNTVRLAIKGLQSQGNYRELARTMSSDGIVSVTYVCEEEN